MDEQRRRYDPRWRRQEVLLAVLAGGSDDEKRAALRELALIGDMDAALAIREYALSGDAYLDRGYHTAFRQIRLRENGVQATSDDEWEWAEGWLEGNFAEMEVAVPPVPGPGAEQMPRIQAAALTLLARGEVADKLPALATLARVGDDQATVAVCRELMNVDPRVQYAARFTYRQIIVRLANGESAAGDHHQQLLHKFGNMVRQDLQGTPPLPPVHETLSSEVLAVAKMVRDDLKGQPAMPPTDDGEPGSSPHAEAAVAAEQASAGQAEAPEVSLAPADDGELGGSPQAEPVVAAEDAAPVSPVELPLAAPTTTAEEAALLPQADDSGLLPQ
ncbi:MAG: hypothetical protein ACM3VW_10795 [Bacteroidota bacterium]